MKNLAIVVTSCDSYTEDCARPFLTLLDRYWKNHPIAYWIAETRHPAGFVAANVNEPCWTKRVRATEDSFVDLAGYAACGCEIATDKK